MDLIKFIIITTIIVILLGCCILANTGAITNYFSSTTLSAYDRYDIQLIDNNDANYIKWIIPGVNLPDNITQSPNTTVIGPSLTPTATSSINPTLLIPIDTPTQGASSGPSNGSGSGTSPNQPSIFSGGGTNGSGTNLYPSVNPGTTTSGSSGKVCPKCPNMPIPDDQLGLAADKGRNFGIELPWDREVGYCEVLKNTDRDLYKNVQDSTTITFY